MHACLFLCEIYIYIKSCDKRSLNFVWFTQLLFDAHLDKPLEGLYWSSKLYQSVSVPRKLLLRNKLSTICMSDIYTLMVSYLARIIVLKDHLVVIGTKEKEDNLVSIMLNWFDTSLNVFVQYVHVHEDLPTNKLWSKIKSRPFEPKSRKWWKG